MHGGGAKEVDWMFCRRPQISRPVALFDDPRNLFVTPFVLKHLLLPQLTPLSSRSRDADKVTHVSPQVKQHWYGLAPGHDSNKWHSTNHQGARDAHSSTQHLVQRNEWTP